MAASPPPSDICRPPAGAFELVPEQALASRPLNAGWRVRRASRAAGLALGFHLPDRQPDPDWSQVSLPHTDRATHHQDTLWYRLAFESEPPAADPQPSALSTQHSALGTRHSQLLRFGAAFLEATVWLNGEELGGHYGHFAPFAFDVAGRLRRGANTLAVCVRTPLEIGDLRRKRHVMGIWNDWDCKPYPNKEIGHLPESPDYPWWAPVGLPRDAALLTTAPVVAEWLRLEVGFETNRWRVRDGRLLDGHAAVLVTLQLRDLAGCQAELGVGGASGCRLSGWLAPIDRDGARVEAAPVAVALAAGERREVGLRCTVEQPWLWWPWTHGEPSRYRLRLQLEASGSVTVIEQPVGLREVRVELDATPGAERAEWRLNGRRIFPKGTNYISDFDPARATADRLVADLALMRAANMDTVRVHAHVEPPEFYAEADRAGMLVMADLPVTFTYVWDAPEEDRAFFRQAVLAQAAEAAHLLQPHPSVALWSVHNEPPWPKAMAYVGAAHHAGWNRDVDEAAAELLRRLAPGASVLAASGDLDEHIYNGWYVGTVEDCRAMAPRFPTEFGAQSLPDAASPFWETVARDWPVRPDEPSRVYADYQPIYWSRFGIGEPGEFESLEAYIAASQAYQAWLLRWIVDWWRIRKFRPTGGLLQFMFVDCHPTISWAVVDYYRRRKLGWAALRDAFAPTHLALDFAGDYGIEGRYHLRYRSGGAAEFALWLVNDDYRAGGEATLEWELAGPSRPAWRDRLGAFIRGAAPLAGREAVAIPFASEGARRVALIRRRLPDGDWAFRAALRQDGRLLSAVDQPFLVGAASAAEAARRLIHIPAFIAGRVYRHGSLRNLPDGRGYAFDLVNGLQPATITGLLHLRLDGRETPLERVVFITEGRRYAGAAIAPERPIITELGQATTVEVVGEPLTPGEHTLEVAMRVVGFGDALVRVRERVGDGRG